MTEGAVVCPLSVGCEVCAMSRCGRCRCCRILFWQSAKFNERVTMDLAGRSSLSMKSHAPTLAGLSAAYAGAAFVSAARGTAGTRGIVQQSYVAHHLAVSAVFLLDLFPGGTSTSFVGWAVARTAACMQSINVSSPGGTCLTVLRHLCGRCRRQP